MTEPTLGLKRKRLRTRSTEDLTTFEPSEKRVCHDYYQVCGLISVLHIWAVNTGP